MENTSEQSPSLDDKISENLAKIEQKKREKLLNLIAEIIVEITLKECYEKSN